MEHDERDRRDLSDADTDPDVATPPGAATLPHDEASAADPDGTSAWPVADRSGDPHASLSDDSSASASAMADVTATEGGPAPAEIESWPSQSATGSSPADAWAAQPPTTPPETADAWGSELTPSDTSDAWGRDAAPTGPAGAEPAWPTEPPAAGSAGADAWPTTPPERGDAPVTEPSWGAESVENGPAEPVWGADPAPIEPAPVPPPSEVEAYPASNSDVAAAGVGASAVPAHSVPDASSIAGEGTQCPRCGTENRPGLAFCRNCGQRLVAAGVATTVERPGAPEGSTACPRCGTHNRAGVAFCQNCGANLRGAAPGYVPPAVAGEEVAAGAVTERRGAILGPIVLLIGVIGLVTGYLLPFLYGSGSLFDRAWGDDGYGVAFWSGYPEVAAGLADQAYFGLAGPIPLLAILLVALAIAGFVRAAPGLLQTIGLGAALLWSAGLAVLFVVVELAANWDGDIVGLLRVLTPAGIIFFLSALIVLIGTLTRFARS